MLDAFDRRHEYLRLALTDRCNLRCRYCMPPCGLEDGPRDALLSSAEILRLLRVFATLGIRKLRLTGGEPTLRHGLVELVRTLGSVPGIETLAMTTNGVLLDGLAPLLREAGLHYLNISLDSLRRKRFAALTGRDLLPQVLEGIAAALRAGFRPLKLNVVVLAGVNDSELLDFVELVRDQPLNVRFIEYMPFLDNGWSAAQFLPYREMLARVESRHRLLRLSPASPSGSAVKHFRIDGYCGSVSFIAPLSDDFCARCNRLRITADGSLKTCLFAPPQLSLRELLRRGATDAELRRLIRGALHSKPAAHPPAQVLHATACQAMTRIGG